MLSNTEGTWLQAAKAKDKRNLGAWQQLHEEMQRGTHKGRPQAAGFDGVRSEIHGLRNDIRRFIGLPMLVGPPTPLDDIKDNKKAIADRKLDAALGYTDN